MPQLKSGRHVGVATGMLVDLVKFGTEESVYGFILAYRLSVREPADLRALLSVVYYRGDGGPPNPPYRSGFTVKDVLSGKTDWSAEEVDEFKTWVKTSEPLQASLLDDFNEMEQAIRESAVWESELVTDEKEAGTPH